MTAYAQITDVQGRNAARATYTASSIPSADQVQGFLDDGAAIIDTTLAGRGFTLPLATTATTALRALKTYNIDYAWAQTERSAQQSPHRDAAEAAWAASLKMLQSMVEPPGLERDTTTTYARAAAPVTASAAFAVDMQL